MASNHIKHGSRRSYWCRIPCRQSLFTLFSISLGSAPSFSRRAYERRSAPKAKAWRSFFCFVFSLRKDSQRWNEILSFWDQSRWSGLLPFPSSYYLLQTLAPTVRLVSTLSSFSLYTARLSTASTTSSSSLLGGGMNSRMKLNPETIIDFETEPLDRFAYSVAVRETQA